MNRIVCVSHGSDTDGITSAALVKRAVGAEVILANYSLLIPVLKSLSNVRELYICDLGLSKGMERDFLTELGRIGADAKIHYIDHHPISPKVEQELQNLHVDLYHSVQECSAVLVCRKLDLTRAAGSRLLAAYGAVSDHMDTQPNARRIIGGFDRELVLLEASLLSYAIDKRNDDDFLQRVVEELAQFRPPHSIEGVVEAARAQADEVFNLFEVLVQKGVRMSSYAYVESPQPTTGVVANMVLGVFDVDVGLAYSVKKNEDAVELSVRGSESCLHNLGDLLSKVADRVGGFGGGHPRASGARIPLSSLQDFLSTLDMELRQIRSG